MIVCQKKLSFVLGNQQKAVEKTENSNPTFKKAFYVGSKARICFKIHAAHCIWSLKSARFS